jgi:uncharacterized membrane protein YhaH (DUF805 family)
MDFKKFYLSPEGRVNRKQFWLWLVLPLTAIEILLALVDVKSGNYNPDLSVGLFSGIFALIALIPAIIVYIKRFHDATNPAGGCSSASSRSSDRSGY